VAQLYSSVQFSYRIHVPCSVTIKTRKLSYRKDDRAMRPIYFFFSQPKNCPRASDVLISADRLFHANRVATEKLCGPKPAVI